MGTKAVFAIESKPNWHYKTIIGMTSDGFPNNLNYIANLFVETAREMRVLTKVRKRKGSWPIIKKVMERVVEKEDDWLFTDDIDNAQWVQHSASFDPVYGLIMHYDGQFEYPSESAPSRKVQMTRRRK